MRKRMLLICVICCLLGTSQSMAAQAPVSGKTCSPAVLDFSALPSPPSFTYGGHVFVLEVQNISAVTCSLHHPRVSLLPTSNTNNQPRYVGNAAESEPLALEPGAWAHLLFVWTSRAGPELNCDLYSGLRLNYSYQRPLREEPDVEIRNFWIRACGPLGVTGYRQGKYSAASAIPQGWLDWYGPNGLRGLIVPPPTSSTEIAATSPLLTLSGQATRVMLGDRLFALKLSFPRLAGAGCALSQLRKREANGSTIIELQQCDDAASEENTGALAVPRYHEAGVMGLYMSDGNLGFMPEHTGPFEYDVVAPIARRSGNKAALQYARARIDLVARDPSLPKQAAILDPLPACTPAQLRIDALPPLASTPLKTLRAYNATNISAQPCSLAGVPRLRGLDENNYYQPFLPLACPNCENELYMPRANGRIDLAEGVSAHLLVASSGKTTGFCTFTPTLELSLNRDDTSLVPSGSRGPQPRDIAQSLEVQFGGGDCVSIDISAWRQGSFDGDPLNSHQADLAHASESISKSAIPAECNKPEFLAHGSPYHLEGTKEPEYAISMEQHQFVRDDPVPLYLWTNNSTDQPLELGGCRRSGAVKSGDYVLYDSYGHRILDKRQIASDERCKADPLGYVEPLVCTVTVSWSLPSHTCIVSPIDLAKLYDLPPGEYTISTWDPGDTESCPRRGEKRYEPNPARDIRFTVLQP